METMTKIKDNNDNTVPMILDTEYKTFQDFYSTEKPFIYKKIAEVFELSINENVEKKLLILAKVNGTVFDATFDISKEDYSLITEKVISYLEELEEYEICMKLHKICLNLQDS